MKSTKIMAFITGLSIVFSQIGNFSLINAEEVQSKSTPSVKRGDIDCNGTIDVSDITELSLALIGDTELTNDQKKAADVDGDGEITLADLARLRQYLSKVILSLDEPPASNTFLFDSYDDLYEALTEQDSSKVFGTDNNGELFDKTIAAF